MTCVGRFGDPVPWVFRGREGPCPCRSGASGWNLVRRRWLESEPYLVAKKTKREWVHQHEASLESLAALSISFLGPWPGGMPASVRKHREVAHQSVQPTSRQILPRCLFPCCDLFLRWAFGRVWSVRSWAPTTSGWSRLAHQVCPAPGADLHASTTQHPCCDFVILRWPIHATSVSKNLRKAHVVHLPPIPSTNPLPRSASRTRFKNDCVTASVTVLNRQMPAEVHMNCSVEPCELVPRETRRLSTIDPASALCGISWFMSVFGRGECC